MPVRIGVLEGLIRLRDDFSPQLTIAASNLEKNGKKMEKVGRDLSEVGGQLTRSITLPILAIGGLTTKLASDFESSFAGVRKTVNATEEEFASLSQGMRDLSKSIPTNVNELNKIGESAGQLGIHKQNILGFTRVMADLGVTTNLSSEQAATSLARLANITQMPQENFDRLGSTIVALGNNFATTEAEIVEMSLRIAGAGNQVGLTEGQILALGTAISSVGIDAEAGGSAISKVMVRVALAVSQGGRELRNFAKVAGMSSEEFKVAFQQDAASAINSFITGLGRMGERGEDVIGTLEAMGITEVRMRDAILRTAGAGDLLTRALDLQAIAWEENNALTTEAGRRYSTFQSQLTITWNKLKDVGITIGQALLPVFRDLLSVVQVFTPILANLAEGFGKLPEPIRMVIVLLAGLVAAIGPVLVIVGTLITTWGTIATTFPTAAAAIGTVTSAIAGPVGWTVAIAGLILAIKPLRELIFDFAGNILSSLKSGISTVVTTLKTWWTESEKVRGILGIVAKQLVTDVISALKVVWDWTSKAAKAIGEAFVQGLKLSGILTTLAKTWDAVSGATKTAVEWLNKFSGIAEQEGAGKLIRVLSLINPAFGQAAIAAAAYTARAVELEEKQKDYVKVASQVATSTENITLTTEEMDRAFQGAANGGIVELSEEAEALKSNWERLLSQSIQLREAALRGAPAYEALARHFQAVNEATEAGAPQLAELGRQALIAAERVDLALQKSKLKQTIQELQIAIAQGKEFWKVMEGRDIGELPTLPEMTLPEIILPTEDDWKVLEEGAKKWGLSMQGMADVTRRAWENIQDAVTGAISQIIKTGKLDFKSLADSIIDIFANMLAELLIKWAANAAKRIILERAVAAASTGGSGGKTSDSLTKGATNAATSNASSSWTAAIPYAAVGAIVLGIGYSMGWWGSAGPTKGQATFGTGDSGNLEILGSTGENASVISKRLRKVFDQIGELISDINIEVERFNEVVVQKVNDTYRIQGVAWGDLIGATSEEIDEAIAVVSIRTAEFGNSVSEFLSAILKGSEAITVKQLKAEIELGRMVENFGKIDLEIDLEGIGREMDQIFDGIASLLEDNLEQLGVGLDRVVNEELSRWQSTFNELTGVELSKEEQLELLRNRAQIFNAEKALRIADLQSRLANLKAEQQIVETEKKLGIDDLGWKARLLKLNAEVQRAYHQASSEILEAGLTALGLQIQAIENLIEGLNNIPDINLDDIKLPGGSSKGGALDEKKRDLERLNELLDAAASLGLSDYELAIKSINDKWAEAIPLAHGNADLINQITLARQAEIDALNEQRLLTFADDVDDFLNVGSGSPFVDQINALQDKIKELGSDLGQLAIDLGLSAHEMKYWWERILAGADKLEKQLASKGLADLAGGIASYIKDEKLRNQLLTIQAQIEFDLRLAQFQMEFEMLKLLGHLTAEQISLIEQGLNWMTKNRNEIIRNIVIPTVSGSGGGGPDPADERARALQRLRDIQARSLDPFSAAIKSVVDEFAELRRVLGWSAEVQATYAQEIQRVLTEQLEPIKRLQDELNFRSDSPVKALDKFRLAQTQLTDAVAALRGGDLSQLGKIPDLARLVLDLIPNPGGSEQRRFIFDWVKSILAQTEEAAKDAVNGIVPGTTSDPWAWLRDNPSAGDQMIANAIYTVGDILAHKQEETTGSTDEVARKLPTDWSLVGVRPGDDNGNEDSGETLRRITREQVQHDEQMRVLQTISFTNQQIANNTKTGIQLRNVA